MDALQGLFVLLMALLTSAEGRNSAMCAPQITPENPVIRLSSPLTLNCSSPCPHGKVKWTSMQDSAFYPGNKKDTGHYKTMVLQSITEDDTSFICLDLNTNSRATVKLYHFSGPTITTDPKDPQTGQPFQLKCEVKIHPEISAELKLIYGEKVLPTQKNCADSWPLRPCEVSTEEITLASKVQYKCEATLQKDSAQRTESTTLTLTLREAALTITLPTKTMPLPKETEPLPTKTMPFRKETKPLPKEAEPLHKETIRLPTASPTKSTASVVTKRVTVQTDQPNTQPSTALKRSAAVKTPSPSATKKDQTILVAVIICAAIVVLVICFVLFFLCKKRKEAQPH